MANFLRHGKRENWSVNARYLGRTTLARAEAAELGTLAARMRVDLKRYVLILLVLVGIDVTAFAIVFAPRPTLDDDGWAFLERQRPSVSSDRISSSCHDCLNFAVFRRGFGGWETAAANLLQLANLPGFLAAESYFTNRQWQPSGTSKEHSDAATLILIVISAAQCAVLALVGSIRRRVGSGGSNSAATDVNRAAGAPNAVDFCVRLPRLSGKPLAGLPGKLRSGMRKHVRARQQVFRDVESGVQ
ncbi:MAG: hypothetical protein IAG10_23635, partial [Planctomycetaceae bacterium]|nr:hypothetical protein [Planctomycetaceae bacterium]